MSRLLLALAVLLGSALANASSYPYQRCFEVSSRLHSVPLDLLLAVAATESNWDANARSHANAHGIMQIQWPGTARYLGVTRVAELYNPCLNIELGSRYLKELIERFGDETRALAAYNYGPGRIERAQTLPAGALKYARKVQAKRTSIRKGAIPPVLQAQETTTLVTFRSRLRADRLAAKLTESLDGASAHSERVPSGHAVRLKVGRSGLSMSDQSLLAGLGLNP